MTLDKRALEEDLSDINVDAVGLDPSSLNRAKIWIKRGTTAVSNLATKYAHKTGFGFSALKSYFSNRRYRVEPIEERGVGGYFSPLDGTTVINSDTVRRNDQFGVETTIHEPWHIYRWLNGSMKRLQTGLYKTFSYLGGYGRMIANYVQHLYEEIAATRLTQKIYEDLGLGGIRGYPSLQHRLRQVENIVGEQRLVYNEEGDAPLIARTVLRLLVA